MSLDLYIGLLFGFISGTIVASVVAYPYINGKKISCGPIYIGRDENGISFLDYNCKPIEKDSEHDKV